ncbi:MAG: pyridoxine/pyridoxamine 5-phosphate oxidase [Bacteroidota bacterium]|jgi:pyridoxamine 5'-phosphate oxidase
MSEWLKAYRENHADFDHPSGIESLEADPFIAFSNWFDQAASAQEKEANAFVLSTLGAANRISSRILYLKELKDNAFIFYTNYLSHKGQDMSKNEKVSMLFFWSGLMRQIRIEGRVLTIDAAISDAYFESRPRESKIGAWASEQSADLPSRATLIERFEYFDQLYPNEVPRPPHWGGYALHADYFEFWQGQPSRLHDRKAYQLQDGIWQNNLLNP